MLRTREQRERFVKALYLGLLGLSVVVASVATGSWLPTLVLAGVAAIGLVAWALVEWIERGGHTDDR